MGIKVAGAVALNGVVMAVEAPKAVEVPLTGTALVRDAAAITVRVAAGRAGGGATGGSLIRSLGLYTAAAVPLGADVTVRTVIVRATRPRRTARRAILCAAAAEAICTGNPGTTQVRVIAFLASTARARAAGDITVRRAARDIRGAGRAIGFAAERVIRVRVGEVVVVTLECATAAPAV